MPVRVRTAVPSVDVLEAAGYPWSPITHTEPVTWPELGAWLAIDWRGLEGGE